MSTNNGRSPFNCNRHYRRALYAVVKNGTASQQEVERFHSLGQEAYPWMLFRQQIEAMKKNYSQ